MPSEKVVRTPVRVRVSPDGLTPKQISEMLLAYEGISKIMEAVKERAITLAHSGVDIPGFEASFTAARRMWPDTDKAERHLRKLGLDSPYAPQELLSPAQAEKALRAAGKWPKRGSAAEDFADPLKPVLGYTDTKPAISKVQVK